MELNTQDRSAPVELDAALLDLVSGGSPKGTWIESTDSPKGTWMETESSPKGTWGAD